MSPPPNPTYRLRARLPRSLAPRGLERGLRDYITDLLELYFPGSEVTAELADDGPPAVTLADGGVPPRAVRQCFASALTTWRRVLDGETEPLPDGRRVVDFFAILPAEGGPPGERTGREVTTEEPFAEALRAGRARRGADGGEP